MEIVWLLLTALNQLHTVASTRSTKIMAEKFLVQGHYMEAVRAFNEVALEQLQAEKVKNHFRIKFCAFIFHIMYHRVESSSVLLLCDYTTKNRIVNNLILKSDVSINKPLLFA